MRWFFHRERSKRYTIVVQELKKTFEECKGWDLLLELSLKDKKGLEAPERLSISSFIQLIKYLDHKKKQSRASYQKFLKILRKLLKVSKSLSMSEDWHYQLRHMLLQFCVARYYRTHFFAYGQQLLGQLFAALTLSPENSDAKAHFSNFSFIDEAHLIENSGPLIFVERDFRQFDEFTLKRTFDSHRYNLPFLLYTFALHREEGLKKIKMVRMGCPTKESWFERPQVVEEFKGLLTYLQTENKTHLYINKQKTWGDEGRRSVKLIELEEQFENYFCVCLPSDGDFYHQTGRFEGVHDMEVFKTLFVKMLLQKVNLGYYHLPKSWREDPQFIQSLQETLDEVHALYFKQNEKMTPKERHLFIDLAYTHLILLCLRYSGVDSVNITCRDGIDRAGCEQSKLLYYFQIALGVEEQTESHHELQFLLHFPVYLAKSRPIVPERREFLSEVFKVFTPEIKNSIREKHLDSPLIYKKPHFVKREKDLTK